MHREGIQMEEEFGEMCPQTQEFHNHHLPEAVQGKEDSPLEPQGSIALTLTRDFRSLEQWGNRLLLF